MNITILPKQHARDKRLADLLEDTREARRLLDRMTASLRVADEQANNLARLMLQIDRSITLLPRPSKSGV